MKRSWMVLAGVLLLPAADAAAQTAPKPQPQSQRPCEPTLSNPCRPAPPPALGSTLNRVDAGPTRQPRDVPRLDQQPIIPDVQLDRNTTFGVGHGGGILGLERKFDYKN
jgi:hypothetical protein